MLDIFCVLETKLFSQENVSKCFGFFKNKGFSYDDQMNPSFLGRILVFWKSAINATIIDAFEQGVLCNFKDDIHNLFVGFIYGSNDPLRRKHLWRKLVEWSEWCHDANFTILGYFNEILCSGDRSSSLSIPRTALDFQNCVNLMDMHEVNSVGPHFTWTNKNSHGKLIASKLDRCLINPCWLASFCNTFVLVDMPGISDHCSLVLHLRHANTSRPKPFKFFNAWTSHNLFLQTVEDCWQMSIDESPMFILFQKQKKLKGLLRKFDKIHFSHLPNSIKALR